MAVRIWGGLVLVVMVGGCSSGDVSSSEPVVSAEKISRAECEAMLSRPDGEDGADSSDCRGAGFDPVWEVHGIYATDEDYDRWRGEEVAPPTTRSVSAADKECPGSAVQVVYNGRSTAGYGDMTASLPTGTRQASPDLPIKLESDSMAKGMHFCAPPGEFLYISLQNPNDSGSISCSIKVDGVTISENESRGAYVIASCDGSA